MIWTSTICGYIQEKKVESVLNREMIQRRSELKIKEEMKGDVLVVSLSGKVIGGPELMDVKTVFQNAVNQNILKVLLDLGKVTWMDSSGLGVIVSGHTTLSRADGSLRILNATRKIHELFIITKLITIFETYNDMQEALNSFGE
jgi:anti-sigma B factor antagonist